MVNPLDAETCHFHRAESQVLQTEKDPVAVEMSQYNIDTNSRSCITL